MLNAQLSCVSVLLTVSGTAVGTLADLLDLLTVFGTFAILLINLVATESSGFDLDLATLTLQPSQAIPFLAVWTDAHWGPLHL